MHGALSRCTFMTVNCDLSGIIRTHNESRRARERQSRGPLAHDCRSSASAVAEDATENDSFRVRSQSQG